VSAPAVALALLLAASPFTAEQPSVREGNERLRASDPAAALDHYRAAEAEAGAHPEIEFDRGDALYAQGKRAEALEAWRKAAEADRAGPLASRALQNTGNALDAGGDREGAARAFTEALRRDPTNEDARYNLEVLLRRKAAEQPKDQPQGQKQDQQQGGQPKEDQKKDQKKEPEQPKEGKQEQPAEPTPDQQRQQDQKQQEQRQGEQAKDDAQRSGQEEPPMGGGPERPEQGEDGRTGRADAVGKQDAERLLDALRSRERNLPLQAAPRKDARRRDVEKDW